MRRVAAIVATVYFSLLVLPATAYAKGGGSGGSKSSGASRSSGSRSSGIKGGTGHSSGSGGSSGYSGSGGSSGYRSTGGGYHSGVSGSSSTYPGFMTWLCLGLVGTVIAGMVFWGVRKKRRSTR
ncbi:hypothetical protein R8Z50_26185 [Longispora sp. K20-0274]|uniref:hypothetical protein n=1 Tax=Longispora sp. K20-0274 TaxID=3088255 RepID=UPI00399BA7D4